MSSQHIIRRGCLAARRVARPRVAYSAIRTYATEEEPPLTDYPKLPDVSRQYLPPLGWEDNLLRRNQGDPVSQPKVYLLSFSLRLSFQLHEQEELYSMWGPDIPPVSPYTALRHFLIAATGIVGAGFFIKYALVPDPPVVRRQYPFDGLVKELGGLEENKVR